MIPVVSPAVPSSPMVKMKTATSTSIKVKPCCVAPVPRRLRCNNPNILVDLHVACRGDCDQSRPSGVRYRDYSLAISSSPSMEVRRGVSARHRESAVGVIYMDVDALRRLARIRRAIGVGVSDNLHRVIAGKGDRIGDVLLHRLRSSPHELAKDLATRPV